VEFPSVLALVAAGRGAAIVPQLALGQTLVTVCTVPPLGGRHIAAWYPAGPAQPTPATATVLDTLAQAGASTPRLTDQSALGRPGLLACGDMAAGQGWLHGIL
jgi:DNA-binding transcriptional LysR family regulator